MDVVKICDQNSLNMGAQGQQQIPSGKMESQNWSLFRLIPSQQIIRILIEQRLIRVIATSATTGPTSSTATTTTAALVIVVIGAQFVHVPDADAFIEAAGSQRAAVTTEGQSVNRGRVQRRGRRGRRRSGTRVGSLEQSPVSA